MGVDARNAEYPISEAIVVAATAWSVGTGAASGSSIAAAGPRAC
jgi:hypothetical protein